MYEENIKLCIKYYNCKLCPNNAKCERDYKKQNKANAEKPKPKEILWDGKRR